MQRYCLTRMESVERVSQDVDVLVSSLQETNFVKKGSSIQLDLICKISNQQQLSPAILFFLSKHHHINKKKNK
jgi:hypothetical protein